MRVSLRNRVVDPLQAMKSSRKVGSDSKRLNLSSSYYSEKSVSFGYRSKSGDSFQISSNEMLLKSTRIDILEKGGLPSDSDKVLKVVKDEFLEMRKALVKKIMESVNGKKSDEVNENNTDENVDKTTGNEVTDPLKNLPEYWNAENTSQRIVDFAISFFELSDSSAEEYYTMMKDAITEGYNSAKKDLGELPDAIGKLSQDTFDLSMKKLDEWAQKHGVDVNSLNETAVSSEIQTVEDESQIAYA